MWETLAEKGVGGLLTPWQTIREGRALHEVRRQELLMLAQAEKDAADVRAGRKQLCRDGTILLTMASELASESALQNTGQRIEPKFFLPDAIRHANTTAAVDQARNEINVSKAVLYAEEQLKTDHQVPSDRDVEDDWLFIWRDYAGRVGAEDLQRLWGSVLAGEVKSPGRYSMRTLELLKTLSRSEAEAISRLARYEINGVIARGQKFHLEEHGLNFGELLRMQEIGLISGVESIGLTMTYESIITEKFMKALISNRKALIVENKDSSKKLSIEAYPLTEVGKQILGLGSFEPDLEYLNLIGKQIASQGFTVMLCDWRQISEAEGQYFNAKIIDT